jgi:hypothetical protein
MKISEIPTTKNGSHELVFPQDFIQNHGIALRGALEARTVLELLRTRPGHPIHDKYRLEYEQRYPVETDPGNILASISVPYVGAIIPTQTEGVRERLLGEQFQEPFHPLYMLGEYPNLVPLTMDSLTPIYKAGFFTQEYEDAVTLVPELAEYASFDRELQEKLTPLRSELSKLEGSLSAITKRDDLTTFLARTAEFTLLLALYQARRVTQEPGSVRGMGFHDSSFFVGEAEEVYASPLLIKKVGLAAEALCLEYLAETR